MKNRKYGYVKKSSSIVLTALGVIILELFLLILFNPLHNSTLQPPANPKIDPLNDLNLKLSSLSNTPMKDAKNAILRASEYYNIPVEVFIGIAFAESSFRNFKGYNPWGIGNNGPKTFTSWEHSADEFGYTMRYGYFNKGLDTPEEISKRYVGFNNPDWLKNVKIYFK